MKMTRTYIVLIGIMIAQLSMGQTSENISADTIPFRLTSHNNIVIEAVLNKVDTVSLMFHTAANDLSLIKKSTENLRSMKWGEEEEVKSWGGGGSSRYSAHNLVEIGSFQWDSIPIWESLHSGPTTDGKFGPSLFKDKCIEIDFDQNILIIHNSLPSKSKNYEQLSIKSRNGLMFIEGTVRSDGKEIENDYLIHSGYAGAVLFDDQFVKDNQIDKQVEIVETQELKDSYGNILKSQKGKLSTFKIGAQGFEEISVAFFDGAIGKQKISVIGGDVLKRFNLILDAKRENIYLQANGLMELPF